jgi:hypothetical protein
VIIVEPSADAPRVTRKFVHASAGCGAARGRRPQKTEARIRALREVGPEVGLCIPEI